MPLYEYTCRQCGKRFTVLVGMTAVSDTNACPHCGSEQAVRRVTRFSRVRGEDLLLDDLADPDDPKAMRRWAKEVGQEMGKDLGSDFEEYLDAAESGEDT